MSFIYCLSLENDKYYVGRTSDIYRRIGQHFLGDGAKWTKLNKPKSVIFVTKELNKQHEDFITLLMMKKYGIENVRGGIWCMQFFDSKKRDKIEAFISCITDKLSIEENMIKIYNNRLNYIVTTLSLQGTDINKFGKDLSLWQEIIEMKLCIKCRKNEDIKFQRPYCYDCWKKELMLNSNS